ncbi:hypothetical protein HDU82_000901 [Entophlyctis luteolus]|nr:hypothetical protein HDU82_000901 [Entophlyctis luteolus]
MAATVHVAPTTATTQIHVSKGPGAAGGPSTAASQAAARRALAQQHSIGAAVAGIPSDPLDESVYNMVVRPGARAAPLYKSKYAKAVRSEHAAVRGAARAAGAAAGDVPAAVEKSGGAHAKPRAIAAVPASKPISQPTSGRIALAAERRSTATTPVVADPSAWDNMVADSAEPVFPANMSLRCQLEEVPEELLDNWEPFVDNNATDEPVERKSSPPPTEMASGAVRKHGSKKAQHAKVCNSSISTSGAAANAGSGRRRLLPEAERFALLAGLKANYNSLMGIYNRLPVTTDTISKINRFGLRSSSQLLPYNVSK